MYKDFFLRVLPVGITKQILLFKNNRRLNKLKKSSHWQIIDYNQLNLEIYLDKDFGLISDIIEKEGVYEPELLDFLISKIPENCTFLDIGANIGQHSLIMSKYCKEVFSFEPIKILQERIEMNFKRNGISNIKLMPFGLSNESIESEMLVLSSHIGKSKPRLHNDQEYEYLSKNWDGRDGNKLRIEKSTFKRLDELNFDKIDFMKIDVEGYEYFVLNGAKESILSKRPQIVMEYCPPFFEAIEKGLSEKLYNFIIDELSYKIYILEGHQVLKSESFQMMPKEQCNIYLQP